MKDLNALQVQKLIAPQTVTSSAVTGTAVNTSQAQADGHSMLIINTSTDSGSGNSWSIQLSTSLTSGGTYVALGSPVVIATAGTGAVVTAPVDLRESTGAFLKAVITPTAGTSPSSIMDIVLLTLPRYA